MLEVGSCFGYSALAMAEVAEHVFAVDPHMEQLGGIPGSLPSLGVIVVTLFASVMASLAAERREARES